MPASAQYDHLLHKTHAERLKYLYRFYTDTIKAGDSVFIFNRINTLAKLAKDNDDDDLLIETGLMRAHYFFYRDKFPKSLVLGKIDQLRKESIEKNKIWGQALSENMLAKYYFDNVHNYELAFEHDQNVYELIKDLSPADFPHKQNCLYDIANHYYYFGNYRESIFYNLQALKAEPPFLLHTNTLRLNITNYIGLAYQKLGMLDSSDHYFRWTYAEEVKLNHIVWQGISSGNLGHNFFLRKEYDKAIPLLQKDVEIAEANSDWALASGSLMILAEINLERGNIAAANEQATAARQYVYSSGQYKRLQTLYPLLAKLYLALGQPKPAAMFLDSALFVQDSISRKFNSLLISKTLQKLALEQLRSDMKIADGNKKLYRLQRNGLVAFMFLLMVAVTVFYMEYRKRYRLKQEELDSASRQLQDFARNISEKNALIETLEQQNNADNNNVLEQLRKSTILTDEHWEHFRSLFEKVHPGFINRLKAELPGLTPAETRFMVLSELGLSTKEMAGMLGVGSDTIRQYRSRVRKKMSAGDANNAEDAPTNIESV